VVRLDSTTRTAIGRLLAAMERANSLAACDALLELVNRPDEIDERNLERAVGALIVRYASPGSDTGAAAFAALFRLVTSHQLGIPPEVAAVFRGLATLEGTLATVDPAFDLLARARDSGRDRVGEAMKPGHVQQSIEDELASLLPILRRLPRRVDRLTDALEHGRLTVNARLFAHPFDRMVVADLLHQMLLTFLGAAAGLMAVLLLGTRHGPQVTDSLGLFALFGYVLLIVAVVLVLRVLVIIFRQNSP
jgi:ubiquinone biosynthesis protein